jgi:hypothetical protein
MKLFSAFFTAAVLALCLAPSAANAQSTSTQQTAKDLKAASLETTATGAANTAVTATLSAVTGQCIYITDVYIAIVANAAVTGAAGPAPIFTTTGLPTNLVWWGNNTTLVIGDLKVVTDKHFVNPLKVPASTAFTIVTSAGQSTESVRINVLAYPADC